MSVLVEDDICNTMVNGLLFWVIIIMNLCLPITGLITAMQCIHYKCMKRVFTAPHTCVHTIHTVYNMCPLLITVRQ